MKKRNDNLAQLIADHWNGQFSQGAAFWGVALISVMAMKALAELLTIFNAIQDPVLSTRLWLGVTALTLLLWLPWALIGALRSILLHSTKLGHAGPGLWLLMAWLVLTLYTGYEIYRYVPGLQRMAEIAFHQEGDLADFRLNGEALTVSGELSYGSYPQFRKVVQDNPQLQRVILDLDSAHLYEARQVAKLIAERQLDTHVDNHCFGNCMIAYAGGFKRSASDSAEFRFYEYLNYVNGYRNDWIISREQIRDREYLVKRGVTVAFSFQLYYARQNDAAFIPTLTELRNGGYINVRLPSETGSGV